MGGLAVRAKMRPRHSCRKEARDIAGEETTEHAAESIAEALQYLRREADAAGLRDVGARIERASRRAWKRSAPPAMQLETLCRAIMHLPNECRIPLVLRKVYRRSCEEIAGDCGISVAAAKARIIEGFRLVRSSSPDAVGQEPFEALVQR